MDILILNWLFVYLESLFAIIQCLLMFQRLYFYFWINYWKILRKPFNNKLNFNLKPDFGFNFDLKYQVPIF